MSLYLNPKYHHKSIHVNKNTYLYDGSLSVLRVLKVGVRENHMENLAFLIGKRLREVRKSRGLRQEDMETLGISSKYYQKIENGKANITLKTLEKISRALDIDPTDLFTLPFGKSPQTVKLAATISEILKDDDEKKAKKINILINEILE